MDESLDRTDETNTIAVAIATMNRPQGIARCLGAVRTGSLLPVEVIVVDQSNDDRTADFVSNLDTTMVPLTYIRQDRLGLSASRNAGLHAATADIVAMTDDDCVPDTRWLSALAAGFARESHPVAVTGRILPLGPDLPGKYAVSSRTSTLEAEYSGKHAPWRAISGGNFAVRRDVWERLRGFDERLGAGSQGKASEDIDFAYRLLRAGCRIRFEPLAVVHHERQELARRLATRSSYGFGIGAFCAKWIRQGDAYAARLLAVWLLWRARAWAGAILRRQHREAREHRLMLGGTLAGLRYGLSLKGESQ